MTKINLKKFLAACIMLTGTYVFAQSEKTVINICENVRMHEYNPQLTSFSSDSVILNGLFEGLFSYNPQSLEPEYALATGHRVSRDKKRWFFYIRQDAAFSNGEPITAQTVVDSWIRLLASPGAPYASLLDMIEGAEDFRNGKCGPESVGLFAIDQYTLSVRLRSPANYLPRVLCHTAFSVVNEDLGVYSGAFQKVSESMLEDGRILIRLEKNPHYWGLEMVRPDIINFYQSDNADDNAWRYNIGEYDWIIADVNSEKLINKNSVQLNAEFGVTYFFFRNSAKKGRGGLANEEIASTEKFSPWDKIEFRSALFEAMPWETLRKNAFVRAETFVFPLNGYPTLDGYSFTDELEASLLMKEAREKYGMPLEQTLPLIIETSVNTLSQESKEALENAFLPLGIEVKIREINPSAYFSNIPKSDADIFCYTWIGDFADPLAFLELFRSKSSLNDAGWENAEYDRLLQEAALTFEDKRFEILAQAETILLDSYEVIPLYRPVIVNYINTNIVGGWASNAFDMHPLKYIFKKVEKVNVQNLVRLNE